MSVEQVEQEMCDAEESQKVIVLLKSSDEEIFKVPLKVALMSNTIKTSLASELQLTDTEVLINLPTIQSGILEKILKYAEKHHNDEVKEKVKDEDDWSSTSSRSDEMSDWDFDFFKVEPNVLHEIIVAAHYLKIQSLLESACKVVVQEIRGKTNDEKRKMFNLENNLTPKEEMQIQEENKWIVEK